MNAATRAIQSRAITLPVLAILPLTRQAVLLILMVLVLLASAFGIIYLKEVNRRLFIQSEQIKQQEVMASEHWTQLLLERGALIAQPRIQTIAQQQLAMKLPARRQIQVIARPTDIHE